MRLEVIMQTNSITGNSVGVCVCVCMCVCVCVCVCLFIFCCVCFCVFMYYLSVYLSHYADQLNHGQLHQGDISGQGH